MNATAISPFDPLDRLEPGEDRFVIREGDRAGPAAILAWCHTRRNLAFKTYGTDPTGEAERGLKAELAQCAEAEAKALEWKEKQDNAGAIEVATRATYIEVVLTEEQVKLATRQRALAEARRYLREAAASLCNATEADPIAATVEMTMGLEMINDIADALDEVRA